MKYRVVQWATGNLGRAAIEGIVAHPELDLVGVWVHSDAKLGKDAGELAGIAPIGVKATNSLEEVIALRPDCVLYSPLFANTAEIERLLAAGINIVTPLNWFYPRHIKAEALRAACEKGGTTLHGTGIHPGGMTERIPLMLSSFSQKITGIRAEEFSDCRTYGATDVLRDWMNFGKPVDEARESPLLGIMAEGFYQSIDMIADEIGWKLDGKRSQVAIFPATAPIESPIGTIQKGQLAAQRLSWEGIVEGRPVIQAIVNWYMGTTNIGGGWSVDDDGERYELEIHGDPPLRVEIHGIHPTAGMALEELRQRNPGMVATANHCVSAIPYVCRAESGLRSYLDLPLVAGRAAPLEGS
jgi:hypothetical protein